QRGRFARARHLSLGGELDLFETHRLNSLRGDTRPRLSQRLDILLEELGRVRGACMMLARFISAPGEVSEQNCITSIVEPLQRYIEAGPPTDQEGEARRRELYLLSQI